MLVKDGRFRDVYIPEDVYQELREAVSERERLVEQMISLSNQVIRWLDIRFPEFNQVFKNWRGEAAWLTLRHFPTPAKVAATGASSIVSTWRKKMKKPSLKKAEKLVNLAKIIGRTAGNEAAEAALQNLLTQYEMMMRQKQDIEQLMQELLIKVPSASKLVDIKGMGMVAAAVIVSEIGDISRFNDPTEDGWTELA
jgi:transposase